MVSLTDCIKNHKYLKVLDLRQENLRVRDVSALVPLMAANHVIEYINISPSTISKKNMQHLWMALHVNTSCKELIYSKINFLAISEMMAIDHEIDLNIKIKQTIEPHVLAHRRMNRETDRQMSLKEFDFKQNAQMNPAIIKYIKSAKKLRSLDMSDTDLRQKDISLFVEEFARHDIRLESLNLSNNFSINHKVVVENLTYLFTSSSTIVHLYLDNTQITHKSVKKIFIAIKDSLKVRTISINKCNLNLTGSFGREIVDLAKNNISLTNFLFVKGNNRSDPEFRAAIKVELALNKQIVDNIFPQLTEQESKAQEAMQSARK